MGTIIEAECICGYKSKAIAAGRGMFDSTYTMPAMCGNCNDIVSVKYLASTARCPDCGKEVIIYNDISLRQDSDDINDSKIEITDIIHWRIGEKKFFRLPDTLYLCPKCKRITMKFTEIGNWD
jgi:predicted RNA-binding Zn-ribbon protein involved in translation (DUF1610 family)